MLASESLAPDKRPRQDRSVITLNEPQIWTIVGVLAATIVGMVTFGFTMLIRVVRVEIQSLRGEMNVKFSNLDRDVNAIMKHLFGIDRE